MFVVVQCNYIYLNAKNDKQQKRGNVLCHASMNIKNHESMCALINEVDGGNTQHCNITFVLLLFQEIIISRSFYVPTSLLKVALNQVNHIF